MNLISNSSGERRFNGWVITKEGGDGWVVESNPVFCGPVPRNEFLGAVQDPSITCCFATSFEWCAKSYLVDISERIRTLRNGTIEIKCGQMYMARKDCGARFHWQLSLLDFSKGVLLRKHEADYELDAQPDGANWKNAEYTFKFGPQDADIVEQIHYLEFCHEGKDRKYWKGHYGMKFARSTVVVDGHSQSTHLFSEHNREIEEDSSSSDTGGCDAAGSDSSDASGTAIRTTTATGTSSSIFTTSSSITASSTTNTSSTTATPGTSSGGVREVEESVRDNSCFQCPICLEIPRGKKIFQCRNGHTICEDCIVQVDCCPQCRVSLSRESGIRNRAMEDAIQSLF